MIFFLQLYLIPINKFIIIQSGYLIMILMFKIILLLFMGFINLNQFILIILIIQFN